MTQSNPNEPLGGLSDKTLAFYRHGISLLQEAGFRFLVAGAYALARYTGIVRHTKDFDVMMHPEDVDRALEMMHAAGFHTELTFPHWLGKVYADDAFIDLIFSSGNGIAVVDDEWFEHGVAGKVLGMDVTLCPPEEMIWSKSFVLERERYDGADVAHLLLVSGQSLDWKRLLRRFEATWHVLFSHLVLFNFIYPCERHRVPAWVLEELSTRLQRELATAPSQERICQGTLISREQYLVDIRHWGYADARLRPGIRMTPEDIAHWTRSIPSERQQSHEKTDPEDRSGS